MRPATWTSRSNYFSLTITIDITNCYVYTASKFLAKSIKTGIPQIDTGRLFEAIMEREHLCSTAIGNGVAFPHPRPFREFTASLSSIALCRLERRIPFGALDNEYVDTLFFIFPKSEKRFLRIQAKLARLLKDDDIISAVRGNMAHSQLCDIFLSKERVIFADGAQE